MTFDPSNNSIFDDENLFGQPSLPEQPEVNLPQQGQQGGLLGSFIKNIQEKLQGSKKAHDEKELELLQAKLEENEETFITLKSFGCVINIKSDTVVEIASSELKIAGEMHIDGDKVEMDDNLKKLFELITHLITSGYRIQDILDKYEASGFYPIGNIEQVPVVYKGTEITVSHGRLANVNSEIKDIFFYRGYEIIPDDIERQTED